MYLILIVNLLTPDPSRPSDSFTVKGKRDSESGGLVWNILSRLCRKMFL